MAVTGSNTLTSQPPLTSIALAPSSVVPSAASAPPTGIPTQDPQIIQPPSGVIPSEPQNSTLIQVGFGWGFKYDWVVKNIEAIQDIFQYLPEGLAYGLGVPQDQIVMQLLLPYDTSASLGYVTTLARAYIPQDMVQVLTLSIHDRNGALYNEPSAAVRTVMAQINPAIPILAGDLANPAGAGSNANPQGSAPTGITGQGAPLGGGTTDSSPVRGTSVGIGVGLAAAATVYGAAMFFVAKRYKKRKQLGHRRSPSIVDTGSMSHHPSEMMSGAGVALMSGGRSDPYTDHAYLSGRNSRGSGRSGSSRGRDISAPVMAENSLGWN
jgi:hypothetical protein